MVALNPDRGHGGEFQTGKRSYSIIKGLESCALRSFIAIWAFLVIRWSQQIRWTGLWAICIYWIPVTGETSLRAAISDKINDTAPEGANPVARYKIVLS
ncbi:hypothetical protein [Primorskyibacter marinus]|uniref:hypothetical protein n=1 Tax=Primorskyibacter marinus TaxID=1977320 RepID=UPI000E30AD13|nr:hypothetical protein [Primorskyibacter marinus]